MHTYDLVFCTIPVAVDDTAARYVDAFENMGGRIVVSAFELTETGELQGLCPMATVGSIDEGLAYLDSLQMPEFDFYD